MMRTNVGMLGSDTTIRFFCLIQIFVSSMCRRERFRGSSTNGPTYHREFFFANLENLLDFRFCTRFFRRYECLENWTISWPSLHLSNGLPCSSWRAFYPRFFSGLVPCCGISLVHSHWSRNVEARLSLVESFPSDACASSFMP